MRITLNMDHVALLGRWTLWWLTYVAGIIVFGLGFRITPRIDELIVVTLLPVPLVIAYALGCLALAWLRLMAAGAGSCIRAARPPLGRSMASPESATTASLWSVGPVVPTQRRELH